MKPAGGRPVAQALGPKGENLVPCDSRARPAYRLTDYSGSLQPSPGAVPDQGWLEPAHGDHDVEDHLTGRCGGADVFLDKSSSRLPVLTPHESLPSPPPEGRPRKGVRRS